MTFIKHYGDITKLSGYELPIVDVITGGSPCQDLSVAGKRAGLDGERSGLFMEQIRIVKEMRERDRANGRTGFMVRPRYCVWENVPGAFSSNEGKDFQAVLTEFARISEPNTPDVPLPENGKWPKSGCIYAEMGGWSIAWRVHDAQFWGVPQRRKRISLVADFGGLSAPEILFERKSVSGNIEQGEQTRKEAASNVGESTYPTVARTLTNRQDGSPCIDRGPDVVLCTGFDGQMGAKAGNIGYSPEQAPTLNAGKEMHVFDARGNGGGKTVCTLTGDHQNRVTDYTAIVMSMVGFGDYREDTKCSPVKARDFKDATDLLVYGSDGFAGYKEGFSTLRASGADCGPGSENLINNGYVVRRLTPLECERLQGYPDGWTDLGDWTDSKGKVHKAADSPRYKALGNSIALPFWQYMARRICAQYERDITMGSLFDGIGGFPLVFERCGAKAVWASEIEEFPIAVTRKHFPDEP